ncbi:hypothetical protein ACFCP7_00920 [Paenibacillus elgii]
MLKRIKLVIDSGNGDFEIVDAFLTPDKNHAYFVSDGIVNYTMAARTQVERVYVECHVSIKLGETARGDVDLRFARKIKRDDGLSTIKLPCHS